MLRRSSAGVKRRNPRPRGLRVAGIILAALALGARAQAPVTLAEALRAVRESSEEARLLTEKEIRLRAQKTEVLAGVLPNIQAYANAGRGSQPFDLSAIGFNDTTGAPTVLNPALNRYSYGIQVAQPIYSFGRVGTAYRTAGTLQRSQGESNQRSLQELELRALDAFYGLVLARARLEVLEAGLKRQGETVDLLQSDFRLGAGRRSEVLLAVSALKALEPQRIRAQSDADAARMSLNRLLGRPIGEALEPDTTVLPEWGGPPAVVSEEEMRAVLERRPDLISLRLQKDAMHGFARVYRMSYLPTLGFQGRWGILAYQFNDQLTDFDRNLEWQVGVGLQWTLFDGLGQSSKARQYDSDARGLELSERQAWAFARIEIESARREVAAADTAHEAARQARDAAEDARRLLDEDFRSGKGRLTDLLAAEEGLRNAEFGLLGARYQKIRARAALRVAQGMDLIEEGSK